MSKLTLLLVSHIGYVSVYGKISLLLEWLGSSGVVNGGARIGDEEVIGWAGGIFNGGGLLLDNVGLGLLIGGINTGNF